MSKNVFFSFSWIFGVLSRKCFWHISRPGSLVYLIFFVYLCSVLRTCHVCVQCIHVFCLEGLVEYLWRSFLVWRHVLSRICCRFFIFMGLMLLHVFVLIFQCFVAMTVDGLYRWQPWPDFSWLHLHSKLGLDLQRRLRLFFGKIILMYLLIVEGRGKMFISKHDSRFSPLSEAASYFLVGLWCIWLFLGC